MLHKYDDDADNKADDDDDDDDGMARMRLTHTSLVSNRPV